MADMTCTNCGVTAAEKFFPRTRTRSGKFAIGKRQRRPICAMCLQQEGDKHKRHNRAITKAKQMLYSHAQKYNSKNGTRLTPAQFGETFNWKIYQMAHDITHNFENWCPYCLDAYKNMDHGLADLTLDIINPNELPYYTNVRYCCATCNRRKGKRGATEFGEWLAFVACRQTFLDGKPGTLGKPQYRMNM